MTQTYNATEILTGFEASHKAVLESSPEWLKTLRRNAVSRLMDSEIPTTKDEEWKYTSLADVVSRTFIPGPKSSVPTDLLSNYADDATRLVFINGHFDRSLSRISENLSGIKILPLSEAMVQNGDNIKKMFQSLKLQDKNVFVDLNQALFQDGIYIEVSAKTALAQELIHIVHASEGSESFYAVPRTMIYMHRLAEATVLESFITGSSPTKNLTNAVTDVYLEDASVLHYCKAQKESEKTTHINNTRIYCEGHARFDGFTFTTATGLVRNDLNGSLNGEGGDITLRSLYSIYGQQHVDNHTCVEHRVPNCTSNQLYKGILNGASHGVFNGKIIVDAIAQQTNSYQLNKTLMLGREAKIDTKPQLEIFADDVKCTHGATIGHLDEDQMFYLQSRSIAKDQATKILSRGFADDVLNYIQHPDINRKLHVLLEPSMRAIGA